MRVYALSVATVTMADVALWLFVLMKAVPDSGFARVAVAGGLVLALGMSPARIWIDVIKATARTGASD